MVTPPGSRLTPSLAQRQVWQEGGLRDGKMSSQKSLQGDPWENREDTQQTRVVREVRTASSTLRALLRPSLTLRKRLGSTIPQGPAP